MLFFLYVGTLILIWETILKFFIFNLDFSDLLIIEANPNTFDFALFTKLTHSRQDFPDRDDTNFMKHSFAFKNENSANLKYKDVELGKYEPMERKY